MNSYTLTHTRRGRYEILSNELKPIDIRVDFNFVLRLEHGQRFVTFNHLLESEDVDKCFTQMSCFDQFSRLIGTDTFERHVQQENVVQSGPNAFVVCHHFESPTLSFYNSDRT